MALGAAVELWYAGLLVLAAVVIEPAKILFLNNAINHGILTPLGVQQVTDKVSRFTSCWKRIPDPGWVC